MNPFSSQKDDHDHPGKGREEKCCCCADCKNLLQEAVNQLRNINLSAKLLAQVVQLLSASNDLSKTILLKETEIMADLTNLTNQVQQNTTVEASAVTLIQGIAAQLAAAGSDPVALQALQDQLNTSATTLAAAVAANTPAA